MRKASLLMIGMLVSGTAMANMAAGQSEGAQIAGICTHIKLNSHPVAETDAATMNVGNEVRMAFNHVLKTHPQLAQQPTNENVNRCKELVGQSLHHLKKKSI
ncbi:hypothetical protein [Rosenbergiella australiborealis]|uniref:Uncharacterized protein n=1 Tax=Rosenbergiella australiborealis TaxID=1544696 RepID=A0ABS5T362_9GAMM|nr:hypothetical protein [Rosenbergiella australiborealis]MBT0726761.1 hypothetical protein [Rosenbergiella australiborealis]